MVISKELSRKLEAVNSPVILMTCIPRNQCTEVCSYVAVSMLRRIAILRWGKAYKLLRVLPAAAGAPVYPEA